MSNDMVNAFSAAFIRRAHQLLFWGYAKARKQQMFDNNTEEEDISQYIHEAIKKMLKFEDLPEEYDHFDVGNEAPVSGTGRTGHRRKRIDILVFTTDIKLRPEFVFEAKRLRRDNFNIGKYVGEGGISRFLDEEYAKDYPSAAIIGYMQSDDVQHWHKKLEEQFADKNQGQLRIQKTLARCPAPIIKDLPDEWQSEHKRPTQPDILIYHFFLDCS